MAKNIINRIDRNLARRLREARRECGLSTRSVSEKLPKRLSVSHTTIAAYENGVSVPPIDVLAGLASIYGRTLNWFLENRQSLSNFRYRNMRARIRLGDKRQFEALAGKWVDAYVNLESRLKENLRCELHGVFGDDEQSPGELAAVVRANLQIADSQPIQNVVRLLESCAVRVLELRTALEVDGLAARHNDDVVVILNPETSNERLRMNVAFELAHVLYDQCKLSLKWSDDIVEKRAYDFASELLLPDSQLTKAFEGKSFLRLIEFKERFGVSLASMIYRAEKRKIIKSTTARWLWSEMSKKGWRRNEPGAVWRDRAIRFETLMETALNSGILTWAQAEEVTGIREDELRQRLDEITEYSGVRQREKKGVEDDERGILKLAFNDVSP